MAMTQIVHPQRDLEAIPHPRRHIAGLGTALLILLALTAAGCRTPTHEPPPKPSSYVYLVGAPDVLRVTILPDPVIENVVVVRPDGMITVDLIGDVPAGGRNPEEIAADIEQRIARYRRDAKVTVAVDGAQSTAITVLGEVRGQGSFPLLKDTRVAEAIGQVGGVSPWGFAASNRIRVIRSGGRETAVYKVDLNAIQKGDLRTNILLIRGDIIYVPATPWAKLGYVIQTVLFPFQPFLGIAMSAAGSVIVP
jgi:polysaccharide export outer membrane protein